MFFILLIDFAAGVPQMPPPQTHASPVLRPVWQPELPHFLLPTPADRHPGSPVFSAVPTGSGYCSTASDSGIHAHGSEDFYRMPAALSLLWRSLPYTDEVLR